MDQAFLDEVTKLLTEKFSAKALLVKGPIQEGQKYRWQVVSTRNKTVTIILNTKKPLLGKQVPATIEVFGSSGKRELKPTLVDLEKYLEEVELVSK